MHVNDDIYGVQDVTDDLLSDLLTSHAVQRLKAVSQAGASSLVCPKRSVTRYEHSVGVMVLTRVLGGSLIEQCAGLLQDVSHTAFSHTIDYVYSNRSESFHENIFALVMAASDVPDILRRYGLTWEHLFCSGNLTRIDVPAP